MLKSLELPKERWLTGLTPLDKGMAGGLYRGFTYGFAGQEKAGKTTLGHTISQNLGCKHLYVALEMGSEMIESRNMARKLEMNSMSFLTPNDNLRKKAATLPPNENIFYLDAPGATFDEITRELAYAAVRHDIKGFIIDYWQLVEGKERGSTEEAHLRSVAQGFANFARKNGLWCILLAQLNKEGQLFGGNGLRKACDQLYFIHQPKNFPSHRWLGMDASRYTPKADIGDEKCPSLQLDKISGPHFRAA